MRLRRGALAAAFVVLLVAGCSELVYGRALFGDSEPQSSVPWGTCDSPSDGVPYPPGAECGQISVPVDYANPNGAKAQLALIRFAATGRKTGSLIINPGGPGESGINSAATTVGALPPAVREHFDLVGFDPRGTGLSQPLLFCNTDQENDELRKDPGVDYSPAGVAHLEQLTKDYVARCLDRTGEEFLANLGTQSVAKDLDAIRQAVGDDKLTYLGYSYGTRIGATYAEQFPDKVKAMILDGAVDPNADPVEADLNQAAAFQIAFNDYAADCAKSPDCPLGTDPAKAVEVYHQLVDPLVETPAPTGYPDGRSVSYGDSLVATILPLYSPRMWSYLTKGLAELRAGNGNTMLWLADLYNKRDPRTGHYSNASDVRVAVNCVDRPPVKDRAVVVEKDRRARELAPFMSYGEFTGHAPLGTCAFWPVPPTSTPHELKVEGLPPTLVVSTTNDPATPYQAGVDLARQLGGALLTFVGTQHTVVFQGNPCVDDIATKYLIDGAVPAPGARC